MTFKEAYDAKKKEVDDKDPYDWAEYRELINEWKEFRKKILSDGLTPKEYNCKNELFSNGEHSLRQFIEHDCANRFFGRLGPIITSRLGLWVTGTQDNERTMYFADDITNDEAKKNEKTAEMQSFLREVMKHYEWDGLIEFLRTSPLFGQIKAPSFIFAMVVLNSFLDEDDYDDLDEGHRYDYRNRLIWIYVYDEIEKKNEFTDLEGATDQNKFLSPFHKSKKLCEICAQEIGTTDMGKETIRLLEDVVWSYSHDSPVEKTIVAWTDGGEKQIILTGAPGTGKTFGAKETAENDPSSLGSEIGFVQFHPSYDYTDFVEGLRPVCIGGSTTFVRMDGIFKDFCRKAAASQNEPGGESPRFYFIIDEINRADLSKVFGELMYCLEYRGIKGKVKTQYRNLETYVMTKAGPKTFAEIKAHNDDPACSGDEWTLPYGEEDIFADGFYIPENVYIIGTMNDIDRSVESFDFALRRRFKWVEVKASETMGPVLKSLVGKPAHREFIEKKMKSLNGFLSNPDENCMGLSEAYNIGPAYFKSFDDVDPGKQYTTKFISVYKNEIEPTLKEYVRGRDQASIDGFLSKCREKVGLTDKYEWLKEEAVQERPSESQGSDGTVLDEGNVNKNA